MTGQARLPDGLEEAALMTVGCLVLADREAAFDHFTRIADIEGYHSMFAATAGWAAVAIEAGDLPRGDTEGFVAVEMFTADGAAVSSDDAPAGTALAARLLVAFMNDEIRMASDLFFASPIPVAAEAAWNIATLAASLVAQAKRAEH